MTRVAVVASITLRRLRGALHRHWRRILGGAFVGWLASSVLGSAGTWPTYRRDHLCDVERARCGNRLERGGGGGRGLPETLDEKR